MSHDEYTKLFKYMQAGFAEMRAEFAKVYARFDRYDTLYDHHETLLETGEQERLAQSAQLDRHETRIAHLETSEKILRALAKEVK